MTISIVIPAFNEAKRLPVTLASISEYLVMTGRTAEVIVIDDGSVDGTAEAARRQPGEGMPPRVISFEGNRGKGAAVREGLLQATGDYVLFMDADNSTRITELDKLLAKATTGVPVVIGSRYLDQASIKIRQPWYRVSISRLGNFLIRLLILPRVKDTQCGFKLLERSTARDIAAQLTMERFSFDIEMLVIAQQGGYAIEEVPVDWFDTPGTRLRPFKSTFQTLRDLLRIRWNVWRGHYPKPATRPS